MFFSLGIYSWPLCHIGLRNGLQPMFPLLKTNGNSPNSFYIITDLFHLTHVDSAPKWFDLLLIFSFAWNGIIAGILSLRRIEQIASLIKGKIFSIALVFGVMWLSAFGIYIGRFLRFNSWDVVTDPFSLAAEILAIIVNPFENGFAWGMTICYSAFMTLLYFTVQKLGEALAKFYYCKNWLF